ncbi:MAG TPA: hypothetical protein VGF94_28410 [Kofleriaceae bacterium]|jgi:hypothetical protein
MRVLGLLAIAACSSPAAAQPAPPAKTVHPVAMDGPYKTLAAACQHARPCGGTDMDEKGNVSHRPKTPTCDAVTDRTHDINAGEAKLEHAVGGDEIRLGGVKCAEPDGLRYTHSEYSVYVHRKDGWWRTAAPVFAVDYNDKYCDVTQATRWNDQPGRTFLGIAATQECVACMKQADSTETLEMMLRVEPDGTKPVVFGPLAVGERVTQTPNSDIDKDVDCKKVKRVVSLDEKWSGADDLVLAGPATWQAPEMEDGLIVIAITQTDAASSAGSYHFAR